MPREDAVRSMLEKTKKFKVLLLDLLGKDYSGKHADRIALPFGGSLVDDNGGFILLRLTGSPLYLELKSSLQNISSVAADLLADAPGKATIDWICKAIEWIGALSNSIDRDNIGQGQLSIQKSAVRELVTMADEILLDVPDDLRRLLSQHGIFVSTNKEGRLTVKSKKGGAHHSIGTTAIRWSPILFESLKEDASRTQEWESKMNEMSARCNQLRETLSSKPERQIVLQCHSLREEKDELLGEASELVVIGASRGRILLLDSLVDRGVVTRRGAIGSVLAIK
jgi:hypothetical protein